MNSPRHPIAATPPPHQRTGAVYPLTYDWRTEPCECDGGYVHGMHRNGPTTDYCFDCNATGMVAAACVECERIVPLDSEGVCCKCTDASILPLEVFATKYHPRVSVSL